jgi:hypothetical protein
MQVSDGIIIRSMHIAYWIIKATAKESECVILVAFPWQKIVGKNASMLPVT